MDSALSFTLFPTCLAAIPKSGDRQREPPTGTESKAPPPLPWVSTGDQRPGSAFWHESALCRAQAGQTAPQDDAQTHTGPLTGVEP